MEIKFKNETGVIAEVKTHATHILKPEEGFTIETYAGATQPLAGMIRISQNEVAMAPAAQVASVNFKRLWGEVWAGALSPVGLVELPPYQSAIEAMWNYPNRSAIYPYMQALVAAGKGNASDLQIIIDAFAAQNIDITTVQ